MPFRTHLLVVANRTVDSPELLAALEERSAQGPLHVTLLAPVLWSEREDARVRLDAAIASLGERGMEGEGLLGDADPVVAVQEVWNPGPLRRGHGLDLRHRGVALDADRPAPPHRPADRLHRPPRRHPAAGPAV